jgi:hypothetical protein
MELQVLIHCARENHEAVAGKFVGCSDGGYLLTKHLKWEVRLDDAVRSLLNSRQNVKILHAGGEARIRCWCHSGV